MADNSNDTERKIQQEDRNIEARQHSDTGEKGHEFQKGSSGMPGGAEAEEQSQFSRSSGGEPGGIQTTSAARGNLTGEMTSGTSGAGGGQSVGSVGTIGGTAEDTRAPSESSAEAGTGSTGQAGTSEYGAQHASSRQSGSNEPLGASHQHSADGGAVTAAGSSSTGAGAGQAGTDRSRGFVGSQDEESGDYVQERDPQQAGFAERGRGAPDEGRDIERGGERTANRDSDIEGSSRSR